LPQVFPRPVLHVKDLTIAAPRQNRNTPAWFYPLEKLPASHG
jgi:hypothetical protein